MPVQCLRRDEMKLNIQWTRWNKTSQIPRQYSYKILSSYHKLPKVWHSMPYVALLNFPALPNEARRFISTVSSNTNYTRVTISAWFKLGWTILYNGLLRDQRINLTWVQRIDPQRNWASLTIAACSATTSPLELLADEVCQFRGSCTCDYRGHENSSDLVTSKWPEPAKSNSWILNPGDRKHDVKELWIV